jgi:hypothetical protein
MTVERRRCRPWARPPPLSSRRRAALPDDVAIDLDDLAGDCVGGDMLACDMVYMYSDIGSEEEALGASCGGRGKTESTCVMEYGLP